MTHVHFNCNIWQTFFILVKFNSTSIEDWTVTLPTAQDTQKKSLNVLSILTICQNGQITEATSHNTA